MMEFTVKPDGDDPYKLEATSRDVFIWEKVTKNSLGKLQGDISMTAMYQLAHIAAKRLQLFTGTLDEFVACCDLDFEQPANVDPTQPGASPGL